MSRVNWWCHIQFDVKCQVHEASHNSVCHK